MTLVYIITLLLLVAYGILLAFYHHSFRKLPEYRNLENDYSPATKITVLIPARNERLHIAACLDSILAQDYPAALLQCIVIDDHSEDDTAAIVTRYRQQGVELLSLKDILPNGSINAYKKKAIETGVNFATGDLIVTTDADCTAGPGWLKTIAHCYENSSAKFIAGPVKMNRLNGPLFNFQSLDFLSLQGITAASVQNGFHSMCNGANLAYAREAFLSVEGFTGIDTLASGDDMLLMHKIATSFPGELRYLKSKAAIVTTEPAKTTREFLQQRIRWASKAQAYEDKSVFRVLLLVYLLNLLLLIILIAAFFSFQQLLWALLFLGIKTGIELPFMNAVARFYKERRLLFSFPFFQPAHIIYTVLAGSFGQFGSYEWKGRKVR